MHFDGGVAVFQLVFFRHRGVGQLALFAHRHKADVQLIRHHRAENKTPRVQAGNQVNALVHIAVHKYIDQHAKGFRVLQQRGDIAELHAGLRPVGHGADARADVIGVIQRVKRGHENSWQTIKQGGLCGVCTKTRQGKTAPI